MFGLTRLLWKESWATCFLIPMTTIHWQRSVACPGTAHCWCRRLCRRRQRRGALCCYGSINSAILLLHQNDCEWAFLSTSIKGHAAKTWRRLLVFLHLDRWHRKKWAALLELCVLQISRLSLQCLNGPGLSPLHLMEETKVIPHILMSGFASFPQWNSVKLALACHSNACASYRRTHV